MENLKEYLRKNSNGTYSYIGTVRPEHVSDFMIEIPEWANFAAFNPALNNYYFNKENIYVPDYVIWQRPTKPEELPFIDDEPINPQHYKNGKVECIDALESATVNKVGIEAVCVANVIKYLWRYEDKNGIEDVRKAKWYLEKLLEKLNEN